MTADGWNVTKAGLDANQIAAEMQRLGDEWSDTNAAACALEEAQKSILAKIANGYRGSGKGVSEAESYARAHPEYVTHVERMVEARRLANRARVAYDVFRIKAELLRSVAATDRALMTLR